VKMDSWISEGYHLSVLSPLNELNLVKGLSLKEIKSSHLFKVCVEGKQLRQKFPKDGRDYTFRCLWPYAN